MTAEIAIMNKEAIAIAADSAVTLREEKGKKFLLQLIRFSLYLNITPLA